MMSSAGPSTASHAWGVIVLNSAAWPATGAGYPPVVSPGPHGPGRAARGPVRRRVGSRSVAWAVHPASARPSLVRDAPAGHEPASHRVDRRGRAGQPTARDPGVRPVDPHPDNRMVQTRSGELRSTSRCVPRTSSAARRSNRTPTRSAPSSAGIAQAARRSGRRWALPTSWDRAGWDMSTTEHR